MASNDVIIRISAQDAASPVFKRITREAGEMGAKIDGVGTKSGGAFDKISRGGAALGATFGVLSGALSDAARAAAEAEAAAARLDQAFENAGLSTSDYTAQIEQLNSTAISLSFDDEDATDALARLVTTTGDVQRAMQDVGIAMDIARARQISLAEATKIVEAIEQGRTGALTRMGIAVDETMSKEEQLAAVQGKYAGQAEAYANTAAGAIERYKVQWENVQEAVGGAMGPLTSVIGLLPGLSTGFTAVSSVLTSLGPAMAGFMAPPMGIIALAAVAVGAAIAIHELTKSEDELTKSTKAAAQAMLDLNTAYQAAFTDNKFDVGQERATPLLQNAQSQLEYLKYLQEQLKSASDDERAAIESQIAAQEALTGASGDLADEMTAVEQAGQALLTIYAHTGPGADEAKAKVEELNSQFAAGEIDAVEYANGISGVAASLPQLDRAAVDATRAVLELDMAVRGANVQLAENNRIAADAADQRSRDVITLDRQLEAWDSVDRAVAGANVQLAENSRIADDATGASKRHEAAIKLTNSAIDEQTRLMEENGQAAADYVSSTHQATLEQTGWTQAWKRGFGVWGEMAAAGGDAAGTIADIGESAADTTPELERLAQAAQDASSAVDDVNEAMGTGYRVIVSNTDAIAQSASQLNDWALELINVRGQYGKIDDLLKAGKISLDEYNAAQDAQESIAQSSLRTQEAVYTIQAKQAPLLAELAENQADYMEGLADLPADQQLAALGFMDTAESARALALAQLAVSDASDAAKESIILGAAEADPVLAQMLISMGLITDTVDDSGNHVYTLNTDQAQSATDTLNDTMTALNNTIAIISGHPELLITVRADDQASPALAALANAPWTAAGLDSGAGFGAGVSAGPTATVYATADTTDADAGIAGVNTRLMELNDATADPDVTASDNATPVIDAVDANLGELDGQRATTYIDTYVTTYTRTVGANAMGGVVQYAANGIISGYSGAMQPTIVGEVGPELLMLPTGSQVLSAPATRSRTGGMGTPEVNVYVQGDVYGIEDLALKVSRELAPAIRDAFGQHYAGQGAWA